LFRGLSVKNKEKLKQKLVSLSAEYLFGSLYLFQHLTEFERVIAFYKKFYDQPKSEELPRDFFEGYKLALTSLLHQIITIAIQNPELIGIRGSEKIDWAYSFGSDDKSSIHKLPDRTT
jgi:hypothetical protein